MLFPEFHEQQQPNLTLLDVIDDEIHQTRSSDKILRLHFHFVKPYNSQTKRNGIFRNVILGSCLLRKEAGTLHQIYICVGECFNKWCYEWGYVSIILDHLIRGF